MFYRSGKNLMGIFWVVFFALTAFLWLVQLFRLARGMPRLPRLADFAPLPDAECPRISIIFSARDEEEQLPRALETMLALDYPSYEIIAVNDRSGDATPRILDEAASRDQRLKVIHITELPPGWLGKPHGLLRGYQQATGEWFVFTDADVRFAPDLLRRAARVARDRGWDHLTLLGWLDLEGFWEKVLMTYFGLSFTMYMQPWSVPDPKSRKFGGVGYFQIVRREAYESSGTHRRLAMEVIDDMKLGKIIKQAGLRSGVGVADERITIRWHAGVRNIIRGVEKNFFAGANYSLLIVAAQTLALLAMGILPFFALFLATGWARLFAAVAAVLACGLHAAAAARVNVPPLYGLLHPFSALVFTYMVLRSTVITLWQGGIIWRGTFYPLADLRKGLV